MQRTGVLSDKSIYEKCANATMPIPIAQLSNVFGEKRSNIFMSRQLKGFRAPQTTTPEVVAKNRAQAQGQQRVEERKLVIDRLTASMQKPGSFDILNPPPILEGSLTQNFRAQNLSKMIKVVERPKQQQVEAEKSDIIRGVQSQPHVVSRILALSNARTPGLTTSTQMARSSTASSSASSSMAEGVTAVGSATKSLASTASSVGTEPGQSRAQPYTPSAAIQRGLVTPSSTIRQDPALRGSISPAQQQLLYQTIRQINNPIMRSDERFEYAQRQLRSGASQRTGTGVAPQMTTERVAVQARGRGPSITQPAKAPPPPPDEEEFSMF
jgi:hypothetical protein